MNKNILSLFVIALLIILSSCEDLMEPRDDNHYLLEDIYDYPMRAEGLFLVAYTHLPNNYYSFNDVATDDAVTNDKINNYRKIATGQWSATYNPLEQWGNSFEAILYINKFLEEAGKVDWAYSSEMVDSLFYYRNIGKAYALRAAHMFYLLQAHAGFTDNNQLLGVPIMDRFYESAEDFQKQRNTFDQCMQQLFADVDSAIKYLPYNYGKVTDVKNLPQFYQSWAETSEFSVVFGRKALSRITAKIAMAYKGKIALLAASPAYTGGTSTNWTTAANIAAQVLDLNNGLNGLDMNGHIFFSSIQVDKNSLTGRNIETLWRSNKDLSSNLEEDNYPPSLFGNGRVNPTQNLVDAFPMANGYPIAHSNSGFNPDSPYVARDPRLALYIIANNDSFASTKIIVETTSTGDDALNNTKTSTRTGYYMKKLLREDVNLDPASPQEQDHFVARLRYTELYLNYAEAANEAWGPDGTGPVDYSARDVIAAIRNRAGITQPDEYLNSITSKEDMRTLIRNERRLELCFEGFRFWDLRRWNRDLTETARGMKITNDTYEVFDVENRVFDDHMVYPPIPYYEALKFNLAQNAGW